MAVVHVLIIVIALTTKAKRGAELQRKYAALANEMAKEYIPEYLEGHQYSWIIPNNSDEMTIMYTVLLLEISSQSMQIHSEETL